MPTHGMDITRDRAFLGNPQSWPYRVGKAFACAIKKPTFIRPPEGGHATVVYIDGEYGLIREPIVGLLSGENVKTEPTTIDAILADDWIID